MASFLKQILEPSEEDAFDHLTWMEKPGIDIFEGQSSEDVLPSPNVGLPSALIPRQPPGPAYVTHTGALVRRLQQQERPGRAAPAPDPAPAPAPARPHSEPRSEPRSESRSEPRSESRSEPRPRSELGPAPGGGPAVPEQPAAAPEEQRTVCHMVIFARQPPSSALPRSSPPCSSQRE